MPLLCFGRIRPFYYQNFLPLPETKTGSYILITRKITSYSTVVNDWVTPRLPRQTVSPICDHCEIRTLIIEAEATVEQRGRNVIQQHKMEALQQIKLTVRFASTWKATEKRSCGVPRDTPRAEVGKRIDHRGWRNSWTLSVYSSNVQPCTGTPTDAVDAFIIRSMTSRPKTVTWLLKIILALKAKVIPLQVRCGPEGG